MIYIHDEWGANGKRRQLDTDYLSGQLGGLSEV